MSRDAQDALLSVGQAGRSSAAHQHGSQMTIRRLTAYDQLAAIGASDEARSSGSLSRMPRPRSSPRSVTVPSEPRSWRSSSGSRLAWRQPRHPEGWLAHWWRPCARSGTLNARPCTSRPTLRWSSSRMPVSTRPRLRAGRSGTSRLRVTVQTRGFDSQLSQPVGAIILDAPSVDRISPVRSCGRSCRAWPRRSQERATPLGVPVARCVERGPASAPRSSQATLDLSAVLGEVVELTRAVRGRRPGCG